MGGLLFVQASVAQKSVTDTVRLTFNIDSVGLDEVVREFGIKNLQ